LKSILEQEDIEAIVQKIVERITPLLSCKCDKHDMEDRLLNVKQLSEYTSLSRQWIYNNKKKLEPEYLNGKPLFRLSKINAMLKVKKEPVTAKSITTPLQAKPFKQQKPVTSL
jgi:hypothetical protein